MRAFVAIDLPDSLRAELTRREDLFRTAMASSPGRKGEVRWVRAESIHLTLKFLGDAAEARLAELIKRLEASGRFKPFTVEVKGFGFFPDARNPRVFWAGVEAPPELGMLAARVEAAAAEAGFAQERRPFLPHLTLARLASPVPALVTAANRDENASMGQFHVSEFFVFESKLSPGRPPEYRKLARLV